MRSITGKLSFQLVVNSLNFLCVSLRNELQIRFSLADSLEVKNLLTFAIYGNYYQDECTYGMGTPEQDIECGYLPSSDDDDGGGGGGAINRFVNPWLQFVLAVSLVLQLITG